MTLFLCYTPLQLFISSRIIAKLKLSKHAIEVFYISKVVNDVTRSAIKRIEEQSSSVTFIHMEYKYPLYYPSLLKRFYHKQYDNVFLASIDNILMHFILSRITFHNLYTFDDGTANIFENSIYYIGRKKTLFDSMSRMLLGINYSMENIKENSILHYTIYEHTKNIIDRLYFIDIFSSIRDMHISKKDNVEDKCSVVLGTFYSDVIESEGVKVIERYFQKLSRTERPIYYIPHPRESGNAIRIPPEFSIIQSQEIAELEIIKLLEKYRIIYIYSFLSSCQLNVSGSERIENYILYSENLKEIPKKAINLISEMKQLHINVINIDHTYDRL